MKVRQTKNNIIITLPRWQKSYDAIGQDLGNVPNFIGVVDESDKMFPYTISHLCDLGYKGTQQVGMPLINISTKEELEEVCRQLDLNIWEV